LPVRELRKPAFLWAWTLLLAPLCGWAAEPPRTLLPSALEHLEAGHVKVSRVWGEYRFRGGGRIVALDPDGKHVVASSGDGVLRVFETATGNQKAVLADPQERLSSVAFSADGSRVASGGQKGVLAIWEFPRAKRWRTLEGHHGEIATVAFAPDGRLLVSAGEDGVVRVWDLTRGKLLHTLIGHRGWVRSVAFSRDGKRLFSGGEDGTFRVWSPEEGKLLEVHGAEARVEITAMAVSPDGSVLAVVEEGGAGVRLWDLQKGQPLRVLDGIPYVLAVGFSAGGEELVVAGLGHRPVRRAEEAAPVGGAKLLARRWRTSDSGLVGAWEQPVDSPVALAISGDGSTLALGSPGGLTAWAVSQGRLLGATRGHRGAIQSISFAPRERLVLTTARDGTARVWSLDAAYERFVLGGYREDVKVGAFTPEGKALAADTFGALRLWDLETGTETRVVASHRGLQTLAITPTGERALSASYERAASWDFATGAAAGSVWFGKLTSLVAFSPDGASVLTAGGTEPCEVRELATGQVSARLELASRVVQAMAYSPDGATVALATVPLGSETKGSAIELWSPKTGKIVRRFRGWAGGVTCLAFSPGGEALGAGGRDGVLRTGSVATGRQVDRIDLWQNQERPSAIVFVSQTDLIVGTSLGALLHLSLEEE